MQIDEIRLSTLKRYCTRQQSIYKKIFIFIKGFSLMENWSITNYKAIVRVSLSLSVSPAPVERHFAFPDSLDQAVKLLLRQKRTHHYSGKKRN